jgi:pSer/pThr/pTyr-binding forkhead associated (FHA) protein
MRMTLRLSTTVQGETRTWPLENSPIRIGRGSANAVQILDATVSKEHAELLEHTGKWTIRDLGSRNGTRVNGARPRVRCRSSPATGSRWARCRWR